MGFCLDGPCECTDQKSLALPFPDIIAITVLGGGCEPPISGKRRSWGLQMVLFERALVSSYRPSIVTFPVSLRVSEMLSLLCFSTPLFPTPPLVSTKFSHVPLGVNGLWATKSERCIRLIVRAISYQDFQPMWSWSTNVTDRRTYDIQSQYSASRGKNFHCESGNMFPSALLIIILIFIVILMSILTHLT